MKNALSIIIFLLYSFPTCCQNWQQVGIGANQEIKKLVIDSATNTLYVSGWFSMIDSVPVYGLAKFDGTTFSQISNATPPFVANQSQWAGCPFSFGFFDNKIFTVGSLYSKMENYPINLMFGYFNGTDWLGVQGLETKEFITLFIDSSRIFLFNPLHVPPITSYYKPFAYTLDQNLNLDSIAFPYSNTTLGGTVSLVYASTKYKNKYYFGGNIYGFDSTDIYSEDFLSWDGVNNIELVDGGIKGSVSSISAFAVFRDELYLGGYWLQANGNLSNSLMKFDGINLHPVFGFGDLNAVKSLIVHNNLLFISGNFSNLNGQQINNNVAYYDGNNITLLDTVDVNNYIQSMAIYNNELYIGGGFTKIGNDSIFRMAKYTGTLPTAINKETNSEKFIVIYPNPSTNTIKFKDLPFQSSIEIYNSLGQIQLTFNKITTQELDIEKLQNGLYYFKIYSKNGELEITGKFVKIN